MSLYSSVFIVSYVIVKYLHDIILEMIFGNETKKLSYAEFYLSKAFYQYFNKANNLIIIRNNFPWDSLCYDALGHMMCAKLRIMVRKSYYENSLNDVSLTDCYEFLVDANVLEFFI